ncbi:MAG: elongation factor 1-beta [Nanoarchaeota archaeon]|nr:elongation factor 1-beta [Nanoarchaeota archaeon]
MAGAAVKIKIMPSSVETNLDEIEDNAIKTIQEAEGANCKAEREPIAFGLNAIIITFSWDEGKDRDALEQKIASLENISSAEIISFVRAFG